MRKLTLFLGLALLAIVGFVSCEEASSDESVDIEGVYKGTLTEVGNLKSSLSANYDSFEATANIKHLGEGEIEVHCYGGEVDTTFMLNYYYNNDSVMVCLNGEAFEDMYGHRSGHGGTMGNDDMRNSGDSSWMEHMRKEHSDDDEHFGGFDMTNNTFGYIIQGNTSFKFQGTKK